MIFKILVYRIYDFWNNLPQSVREIKSLSSLIRCINVYFSSENALNALTCLSILPSTSEIIEKMFNYCR